MQLFILIPQLLIISLLAFKSFDGIAIAVADIERTADLKQMRQEKIHIYSFGYRSIIFADNKEVIVKFHEGLEEILIVGIEYCRLPKLAIGKMYVIYKGVKTCCKMLMDAQHSRLNNCLVMLKR